MVSIQSRHGNVIFPYFSAIINAGDNVFKADSKFNFILHYNSRDFNSRL